MKILFLSRWFPFPPDNGARIRVFNLLKGLAEHHQVDLIAFQESPVDPEQIKVLEGFLASVTSIPYKTFHPGRVRALLALFSDKPRSYIDAFNADFADKVREAVSNTRYDLVIASEIDMALYALMVDGVRKILEELEITKIYDRYQSESNLFLKLRHGLTWWKLSGFVAKLLSSFDGCTVVSELEKQAVHRCAPDYPNLIVLPNGVDIRHYQMTDAASIDPNALVYMGAITYPVNFEAVKFFVKEVFPEVLSKRPSTVLYVTGGTGDVPVDELLLDDRVIFTGYIDDIRVVLSKACVNVIPILTGGGTRLKVLEGFAAGTPIVSTSRGAEGLEIVPGKDFLLADEPGDFANAVVRLMEDAGLRAIVRANGRAVVEEKYDWQSINQQLETFILDLFCAEQPQEIQTSRGALLKDSDL